MIAESRYSPLAYLRAKDIEPDWPALYEAFDEPDSMRIADIHEGEMNVDTFPGGLGTKEWTTEYPVEVRFERRYGRGTCSADIDPAGVRDAFDAPAAVTQTEWSVAPDDRVVNVVVVKLLVRERFGTPDKSATEPMYTPGDGWTGIASTSWPSDKDTAQSSAQDDAVLYGGETTWVTTGIDGEEVTLTQDGDAWVDGEGNRYHIETDGLDAAD